MKPKDTLFVRVIGPLALAWCAACWSEHDRDILLFGEHFTPAPEPFVEPDVKLVEHVINTDRQGLVSWEENGELFAEGFPMAPGWEQRWVCEPPSVELAYRVLRDVWSDDLSVRTVYEIQLVS